MATATDKAPAKGKDAPAEAPAKKKKSKKKLIIILVVVLLVAGVGYKKFMAPAKKPVPGAAAVVVAPKLGPLVAPDAITVNLAGGHYLRIGLALQFSAKVSMTTPPDGSAALDQTISYLTGQTATTLESPAGLATVKAALTTRITKVYPGNPVLEVLITSFVIQ